MDALFVDHVWILPLAAFVVVVLIIPVFIKLAPFLQLVDAPGGRKLHEGFVPLIGGLVIFPVFIISTVLAGFSLETYWPLYSAIGLLLLTGVVDDKFHLHAWLKFFMQFCAAGLIIIPGGAEIHQLNDLFGFGLVGLDLMSLPFSFAAVVLLINAVNLMDGVDGLAAGITSVAIAWMAFGFYMAGQQADFMICLILIACIFGFLVYNMRSPFRSRAVLFLGDAGSLSLGLCLAWFAIHVGKNPVSPSLMPISVAWILAIPIMDTCAQFYRRVRAGKHPFSPDRGHFHHHFIYAGVGDGWTSFVIICLVFLTGLFGVVSIMIGVPQVVLTVLWIAALLSHIVYSRKPERYIRLIACINEKCFGAQPVQSR